MKGNTLPERCTEWQLSRWHGAIVPVWRPARQWYKSECSTLTVSGFAVSLPPWGVFIYSTTLVWLQLHCSSIKSSSWLLNHLYPALKPFNLDGCGLFQNVSAHIHRARGLTEWLAEDENDLNHMLWPSHSPDLSIIGRFIGDLQPMCWIALSNTNGEKKCVEDSIVQFLWPDTLMRHFMLGFLFICYSSLHIRDLTDNWCHYIRGQYEVLVLKKRTPPF